jgi:hypothetical protein
MRAQTSTKAPLRRGFRFAATTCVWEVLASAPSASVARPGRLTFQTRGKGRYRAFAERLTAFEDVLAWPGGFTPRW